MLLADKNVALEVLKAHVKNMKQADMEALVARMRGPHGFFKDAALSQKGIQNVFKLRSTYTGQPPLTDMNKYVDLSWAERAKKK